MTRRKVIVLATRNKGKVEELRTLLTEAQIDVRSIDDYPDTPEVEEDAGSFEGNALKKAEVVARHTGEATLADDSGLEVVALDGEPGVNSARYAGPDADDRANRRRLLDELNDKVDRTAQFRCVLAFVGDDVRETFEGVCEGTIAEEELGQGGFGYDPVFIPANYEVTFAEMSRHEKNMISHRGRAMRKLKVFLLDYLGSAVATAE